MSTHLLAEAALRSLIMGAIIVAALRLLRIHQVRAQRMAWLFALLGALAMPALVSWQIGPQLLPQLSAASLRQPAGSPDQRAPAYAAQTAATVVARERTPQAPLSAGNLSQAAAALYCIVAAVLLIRLCLGVGFALRLRNHARQITIPFASRSDIRISRRIATPVTIASSVLLPVTYSAWDEATLRVVLSHERAHVRQRDFYVHIAAGLHCALFWFNPYSWWLRRQLSELGEALSDCAAVAQAQSRASYAEILLAFAARAPWPVGGVAMARASSLTPRIERLLDDRGFEKSFAGKRRQGFVAAGAVLLAMIASTSMVRVRAASPDRVLPDPAASAAAPAVPAAPEPPPTPAAPAARVHRSTATSDETVHVSQDDEILSVHAGDSQVTFDSGSKVLPMPGEYIYYQHDGKPYVIQDPSTLAKARALLAPLEELGRQQQELGKKQQELGRQQAMLGKQQKALGMQQLVDKLETPDFKRDIAELENVMRQMDLAHVTVQIDQKALAELQSRLGEIQGRVAALQAELGMQHGKIGEQQGVLGEQQGKLGEAQGRLGEQQRKIAEEVRRQLRPLVEQAIHEGKVKPMN